VPLDGWTKIARAWSDGSGGFFVHVSPNTQFVVYETDATLGSDVDPYPTQRNLYELDRSTGLNHLIAPAFASAVDVRDDGAVLVEYRDSPSTALHPGIFTIDGGLVAFVAPTWPTGCAMGFENGGPGLELGCDGTDTQATGLYRFDVGDTNATPVATVDGLPPEERHFFGISPNRRYLEVGAINVNYVGDDRHYVYDTVAGTVAPSQFWAACDLIRLANGTCWTRTQLPVADDGRLLIWSQTASGGTFLGDRLWWFDPSSGHRDEITEFDNVLPGTFFGGSTLFSGGDDSLKVNHPFNANLGTNILADLASPSRRWQVPTPPGAAILAVSPGGDVVGVANSTTEPGESPAGADIVLREGPLP
jgi:hypothetical protein